MLFVFVFIEILFKILLFKGGVLIYTEHMYIYKLLKFFHVIFYSFYLTITRLINTTQLKIPELNVK